jgi:type IV secretory pathway TrbD component
MTAEAQSIAAQGFTVFCWMAGFALVLWAVGQWKK